MTPSVATELSRIDDMLRTLRDAWLAAEESEKIYCMDRIDRWLDHRNHVTSPETHR